MKTNDQTTGIRAEALHDSFYYDFRNAELSDGKGFFLRTGMGRTDKDSTSQQRGRLRNTESEEDAWTGFADLDDGIWEVYISGEKRQNGSVVKRITTEAQLLEVRKEGDAGYDLCPSLIQ